MNIKLGHKAGSGSPRKPVTAPDSASSKSYARIVYGINDGHMVGFIDGLKSLILDNTPVQSSSGDMNITEVEVQTRWGTNDQDYLEGFPSVVNEIGYNNVEIVSDHAFVHYVNDLNTNAVGIRFTWGKIFRQNESNGDVNGYRIDYAIDVQADGNGFVEVLRTALDDKTSSGYERYHRLELPPAEVGWEIRVRRLTANATSDFIGDKMFLSAVAEIVDAKLRYPNTALIALKFDADKFGSIPKADFRLRGKIIKVPTNYDPETRTYAVVGEGTTNGIWDGSFKLAYTNNPVWIFYDLLLSKRYGLGERLDASMVDKWALYSIGQYCDTMVPDGMGGTEPRLTCNVYINSKYEAFDLLMQLASTFRGILHWDGASIVATADRPSDPVFTFTRANIIGEFNYSGTRARDRSSMISVAFDDPANNYKTDKEVVSDTNAIAEVGVRLKELTAFGCTSRGQAQRIGRLGLLKEQQELRMVTFTVGLDGYIPVTGKIIEIADPLLAGRAIGGRISAVSANGLVITLDREVTANAGDVLVANGDDGIQQRRDITQVNGNTVTVSAAFTGVSAENVWAIDSEDLSLMRFRVLSVAQNRSDDGLITFTISGVQHNPTIDEGADFAAYIEQPTYSNIEIYTQVAPTELVIGSENVINQGLDITNVVFSWPQAVNAVKYELEWRRDNGSWIKAPTIYSNTFVVEDVYHGLYEARIVAINSMDVRSLYTLAQPTIINSKFAEPPMLSFIQATGIQFGAEISWVFPAKESQNAEYVEVQISYREDKSDAKLLGNYAYPLNRAEINGLQANLKLWVKARIIDRNKVEGPWTVWVTTTTDAEASILLDALSGKLTSSQLDQDLTTDIATGVAADAKAVAAKLAADAAAQAASAAQTVASNAGTAAATAQTTANRAQTAASTAQTAANNAANAVAKEVTDRIAAVTAETNARTAAITKEATDRAAAITKEATDRATALTAQANTLKADSAAKVKALKDEVDPKITTLQNGITQVTTDYKAADTVVVGQLNAYKTSNDSAVASVLQKAESAVSTGATNSSAITAINGQITKINGTLSTKLDASVIAGYYTKGQTDAKAAEIAAGKVEEFNANLKIGGRNLWNPSETISAHESSGSPTNNSNAAHRFLPTYLEVSGSKLLLQIWNPNKVINNSNTNRVAFYTEDKTYISSSVLRLLSGETYQKQEFNIPANAKYMRLGVISGLSTYDNSIKFKFELGTVYTEWTASEEEVANSISSNSTAIQNTNAEVSRVDGRVTTESNRVTTLTGRVSTVEGSVATKAEAAALTALTTRVSNAEGVNTSQGSAITTLENSVNHATTGLASKASSTALTAVDNKVTAANGRIDTTNSNVATLTGRVSTVEGAVSTKAEAAALTALTTRVSNAEGVNTSQGSAITSLENSVNHATTGLASKASSSALTAVDNKVTAANGRIDTTNSNVSTLSGRVSTVEGAVATKAEASALTALTTRVSNAEGVNTSQGSAITTLQNTVNHATTGLSTKASTSALTATNSEVTRINGVVTGHANQLTQLSSDITAINGTLATKANASALNDIYTKTQADTKATEIAAGKVESFSASLRFDNTNLLRNTSVERVVTGGNKFNQTTDIVPFNENTFGETLRDFSIGDPITFSFRWEAESGSQGTISPQLNATPWAVGSSFSVSDANLSGYHTVTIKITQAMLDSTATLIGLRLDYFVGKIKLTEWMLQHSSKATGWEPSYLDVQTSLDANATAINNTNTEVARVDGRVTTESNRITSLTGRVDTVVGDLATKADASALNSLTTRVATEEGKSTSQGTAITSLQNTINHATTGLATKASSAALTTLDNKVTAIDGRVTSNSSSITTLNNSLTTTNTNVATAQTAAQNAMTAAGQKGKVIFSSTAPVVADRLDQNLWIDTTGNTNTPKRWNGSAWVVVTDKVATDALAAANAASSLAATKADSSALTALDSKVTTIDGKVTTNASNITTLQGKVTTVENGLATKAEGSALTALTTRVTNAEGVNTSQGSAITTLQNTVNHATTGLSTKASTSALNTLDSKVTGIDGRVTANATSITNLQSGLATANNNIATKADGSALTALTTRVSNAEGGLSSVTSNVTALTASLNAIEIGGTNLMMYSAFETADDVARWAKNNAARMTVSQVVDTTCPSGATNVTKVDFDATTAGGVGFYRGYGSLSANSVGKVFTASVWMKASKAGVKMAIISEAHTSYATPNVVELTTEWKRYTVTATRNTSAGSLTLYTSSGAASSTVWVSRLQYESGNYPTAWQPCYAETQAQLDANATANTATNAEVSRINGVVVAQGTSITNLQAGLTTANNNIATKADGSALTALTTRVTNAEGVNTSQGSAITTLQNTVNHATTGLATKASSAALTTLDNKVTSIDGRVTTNSTNITTLQGKVTTVENGLATKADGSALSSLATRVSNAEGNISTQSTALTKLSASLQAQGANLQQDGGFEALTATSGAMSAFTADKYSGSQCLKFARVAPTGSGGNNDVYWGDFFDVAGGRTYYVEAYVRRDPNETVTPNVNTYFTLGVNVLLKVTGAYNWLAAKHVKLAELSNTWSKVSGYVTVPNNYDKGRLWLAFPANANNVQNSSVLIDAVFITDATEGFNAQSTADATAAATDSLTTRVTTAEGNITSQGTRVTNLENSVNNATTGLTSKASAQALTTLNNQVQHSTTGLSAVNTKVDSLKATIENPTSGLASKASSSALDTLSNKVNNSTTGLDAIASKTTVLETDVAKALDVVTIKDTRSTNQPPSWYWTNYARRTVNEFKTQTVIGVNGFFGGTYCNLETNIPYSDASGGAIVQTATSSADPSLYVQRVSTSTTAWGAWAQPLKDLRDGLAGKASASAVESLTTRVSTAEGTISSEASKLSTLSTTVGGHTSSISTQQTSINGLNAKATIQVAAGNTIGGVALGNDGGNVEFIVRSNVFAVAPPVGTSGSNKYMMSYRSTAITLPNGTVVPAGLYLNNLVVDYIDASKIYATSLSAISADLGTIKVGSANIADLAVDTMKIKDNAVTVPIGATWGVISKVPNFNNQLLDEDSIQAWFNWSGNDFASITLDRTGGKVAVSGSLVLDDYTVSAYLNGNAVATIGSMVSLVVGVFRNGVEVARHCLAPTSVSSGMMVKFSGSYTIPTFIDTSSATGNTTYTLKVAIGRNRTSITGIKAMYHFAGSSAVPLVFSSRSMLVLELKK